VRNFVAIAIAATVAMLIQTTVFPAVPWLPVMPDLMLVLAVYLGIRHHSVGGAAGAFVLGYFLDTFAGTLLGLQAFALTAAYVAVYLVARHLWMDRGFPVIAVAFLAACVRGLALVAVGALVAAPVSLWHHVVRYGLFEAGAAALVTPIVFAGLRRERELLGLA
jgi:rod shape-determining protein MreD